MSEHPYLLSPSKLKKFLDHIQSAGVPAKVTNKYLESAGYKSKNDRRLITVLKRLGFLDASGIPTKVWQRYRSKSTGPAVLAAATRDAYSDLFALYPDAHRKDTEALRHFFSTHSKAGDRVLSAMVGTFQTLASLGDFGGESPPSTEAPSQPVSTAATPTPQVTVSTPHGSDGVTINVNIEIAVPPSDDPKVYDSFFAAMKKHLLK